MKLIIKKDRFDQCGEAIPRYYGIAYEEVNSAMVVYAIIPLNVILYYYEGWRYRLKTFGFSLKNLAKDIELKKFFNDNPEGLIIEVQTKKLFHQGKKYSKAVVHVSTLGNDFRDVMDDLTEL